MLSPREQRAAAARLRRGGGGGRASSQQLGSAAVASVMAEQRAAEAAAAAAAVAAAAVAAACSKEFFSGDRFQQQARLPNGEWRSRYKPADSGGGSGPSFEWRPESKMRTVAGAVCLCLNIGVDPPGVDRPSPCATLECWMDPNEPQPPAKALEMVGSALTGAYLRLQPKAKIEPLLDPTSGAVKRMCVALRRHAKMERVLFHYNGHGVPRPTTNGEIWVFDKSYTLYVPLSLDDLLNWLGGPCILVLDCSGAGALIERFQAVVRQKKEEAARMALTDPERAALLPDYGESILLGCCSASQSLPLSNPSLPLDLFTSCLTSPLRVAFKVFALTSPFGSGGRFDRFLDRSVAPGEELLDKIPGKASDRKTPLGELHWIYTAVTDTIAWNILPPSQFQRLFRQDMLLASLLRNFLLATRVMASVGGCTTFSVPGLPHASLIAKHPLWASWDLVLEQYLLALDKYLTATGQGGALAARDLAQRSAVQAMNSMAAAAATNAGLPAITVCATGGTGASTATSGGVVGVQVGVAASPAAAAALAAAQAAASGPQAVRFSREHLSFFSDHLTAFDLSLEVSTESSGPPIQLPIVLQVLLSQVHRRRALVLLARFMGKGSWAVTQALSVGIFPYVLKLLQSPDVPLREVLVFIWSKLLALDRSVQADVVREGHELYFVNHLASPPAAGGPGPASHGQGHGHGHGQGTHHPQGGVTERQRVMSAFVLAALCDGFPAGQQAVLRTGVLPVLAAHLESESPSLRKWMCLLLGKLWQEHEDAKVAAVVMALPEKLCGVIADPVPEVRAAALYALGTFMASTPSTLYPQQQQHASAPMSQTSSSSTSPAHRPLDNPYGMQQPQQPHLHPQDGGRSRAAIELMLAKNFSQLVVDASPLVREELAIALSRLVEAQADEFVTLAHERSNMQQQPQHANYMSADAEAAAAAHGGGSVPQSPLHTGMSSPGMSPTFAPQQPLHHHHHSSGSVSSSASATPSMGPLRSPSPSPPAQTATGLAIALSPAMMAATGTGPGSTGAANTRVATPLSPLQLQQGGGSVSGGAGSVSSTWNASGATTPLPRTMSASSGGGGGGGSTAGSFVSPTGQPLMQQQQQRQSLTRNNSAGSVYQAGGGGGTVSGGGGSPADAALYHQRLLIWRVVRTLSHDPFPAVAVVAIALRKLVAARATAMQSPFHSTSASISFSSRDGGGMFNTGSMHQLQHSQSFLSPQGSPMMQSSNPSHALGGQGLSAVPEQPLTADDRGDYEQSDSAAKGGRARSESAAATTANFDLIVTRPRGGEHHAPPPAMQPPPAAAAHVGPASILGAGGVLSQQQQPQSSFISNNNRAPSPTRSPSASSAASPVQHAMTHTSGNTLAAPLQLPPRRSINGSVGGSTSGGSTAPETMGMVGAPLGGGALSATAGAGASSVASASIPPSSIYARSCEYFIAPVGAVSVSSSAQAMVPSGGGATAAAAAAAAQQHASSSAFDSADRVLEALLTAEWRRKRNEGVIASASSIRQDLYDVHERGTFEQVGALSTGFEQVSALLFHPFEPLLVVGEKRQVGVWDVKEMERINLFSNENARGTKISALQWINEQHVSLLLAGSDDGVVRLWKNVHVRDTAPEIVSAWLAVRSMPRGSGVGLVLDWQQETGHLLAAGPVDSIRVWDVEREICVLDLPVDSNSYVSSVCSMAEGGVVFAGCGDGVVRMFDLRADNHTIHTVSKHTGSVVNVHMQRWGGLDYDGDLISGGVNGDIHLSDTRMLGQSATAGAAHSSSFSSSSSASALNSSVVRSMAAFDKAGLPLDALAVHEHAPLFAAGSRKQVVRIADFKSSPGGAGTVSAPSAAPAPLPGLGTSMPAGLGAGSIGGGQAGGSISLNHSGGSTGHSSSSAPGSGPTGATVSTLKYFKGFMGHRIGPVTSLAFHPHKLLMAVGAFNPLVSIMAAFPPSSL